VKEENAASGTTLSSTNGSTGERTVSKNETVEYTNILDEIVPTGIQIDFASLALVGVLTVLLAGVLVLYWKVDRKMRSREK
jgi:hypothetical protein